MSWVVLNRNLAVGLEMVYKGVLAFWFCPRNVEVELLEVG